MNGLMKKTSKNVIKILNAWRKSDPGPDTKQRCFFYKQCLFWRSWWYYAFSSENRRDAVPSETTAVIRKPFYFHDRRALILYNYRSCRKPKTSSQRVLWSFNNRDKIEFSLLSDFSRTTAKYSASGFSLTSFVDYVFTNSWIGCRILRQRANLDDAV